MRFRRRPAPDTLAQRPRKTVFHIKGEVELLRIQAGDIIILTLESYPETDCVVGLIDHLKERFPDNEVLVVGEDLRVEVESGQRAKVRPSNAAARAPWLVQLPPPAERTRIREAAGLSLREMGALIGVSHTAIANWELGSTPQRRSRAAYAQLLEELSTTALHGPHEDPGEDITDTSYDGPPTSGTGLEHPDWKPTIPARTGERRGA